jgi:hypothetical protein
VIYKPDLIARRRYMGNLLGFMEGIHIKSIKKAQKRVRRHDQLMAHMETAYSAARKTWYYSPVIQKEGQSLKKSLETKQSRDEFVRKAFEVERAERHEEEELERRSEHQTKEMLAQQRHKKEHMEQHRAAERAQGASQETAIELD